VEVYFHCPIIDVVYMDNFMYRVMHVRWPTGVTAHLINNMRRRKSRRRKRRRSVASVSTVVLGT